MGSGALCKCGYKLNIGTEVSSGVCFNCQRSPKVRSVAPLVTVPRPTVTVPIEDVTVLNDGVTVPVRKQRKWERNNPEKTKADTAARVVKWRHRRAS